MPDLGFQNMTGAEKLQFGLGCVIVTSLRFEPVILQGKNVLLGGSILRRIGQTHPLSRHNRFEQCFPPKTETEIS